MSRYENTRINKNKKNVKHLQTTIYGSIPENDNDIYVIAQMGDRLDNLATQFYGDASLWWYIAKANGLSDFRVEAGTSLRIPASKRNRLLWQIFQLEFLVHKFIKK